MFLIFNCYYCYSLLFLLQKPCQKLKLLIMSENAENGGVRFRTLDSFSDTWGVQFRAVSGFLWMPSARISVSLHYLCINLWKQNRVP